MDYDDQEYDLPLVDLFILAFGIGGLVAVVLGGA